jgi:hypothetical protein
LIVHSARQLLPAIQTGEATGSIPILAQSLELVTSTLPSTAHEAPPPVQTDAAAN